MLTRRQLIKTGMAGSVVLLAAGLLATPQADCRPGRHAAAFPAAADAQILRSIAPVMLGMSGLPLDESCAGWMWPSALMPAVQQELRQLFDLLANRWARGGWPAYAAHGRRRRRGAQPLSAALAKQPAVAALGVSGLACADQCRLVWQPGQLGAGLSATATHHELAAMSQNMSLPDPIAQGVAAGWRVLDGAAQQQDLQLHCDVLIIGTGAGGGMTAEVLARPGWMC
jgi:hypothetical protein